MIRKFALAATLPAMLFAAPALADVKAGVDAWERGEFAAAIKEWRPLAIKGDADAQFNLGQAYRYGRGVTMDMKQAEDWYRRAAQQGHPQAEDNLGLIMFQNGDRKNAMPYIQKSADRGEPRAQYVLGTALFNGDFVKRDYVRAYALMIRASQAGLPRASSHLAQMDKYIPLADRQQGMVLARELELAAARPLGTETAAIPRAAEAATPTPVAVEPSVAAADPVAATPTWNTASRNALPPPPRSPRLDTAPPGAVYDPPVATASAAPAEPEPVYEAPAAEDSVSSAVYEAPVAQAPVRAAPPAPRSAPPATRPAPVIRTASPPAGKWRVQLGAFSEAGRADSLWQSLRGRVSGLSGLQSYLVKAGAVTRLQAGPLASRDAADRVCGAVKASGQACMPVAP